MTAVTHEEYLQILRDAGLEGANDSGPEFRYGFRIVEKDGKKVLRGLTVEEHKAASVLI